MADFVGIGIIPEETWREGAEAFCGLYRGEIGGEPARFLVRREGDRLRLDAFWPDLALLPRGDGLYEIEGFPFSLRFSSGPKGGERLDFAESWREGARTWTLRRDS